MERPTCLNVSPGDCTVAVVRGRHVVRYRGEEYYVIGLYLGHSPSGRRELRYVLSTVPERDRRLIVSADDRQ